MLMMVTLAMLMMVPMAMLMMVPIAMLTKCVVPLTVWAIAVARVIPAAGLVARSDLLELVTLGLLLSPVGIRASGVACLILATCGVAQHVICETLQLHHR